MSSGGYGDLSEDVHMSTRTVGLLAVHMFLRRIGDFSGT